MIIITIHSGPLSIKAGPTSEPSRITSLPASVPSLDCNWLVIWAYLYITTEFPYSFSLTLHQAGGQALVD